MSGRYDTDTVTWAREQAALLRRMATGERVNDQVDWDNIIDSGVAPGNPDLVRVSDELPARWCRQARSRPARCDRGAAQAGPDLAGRSAGDCRGERAVVARSVAAATVSASMPTRIVVYVHRPKRAPPKKKKAKQEDTASPAAKPAPAIVVATSEKQLNSERCPNIRKAVTLMKPQAPGVIKNPYQVRLGRPQ